MEAATQMAAAARSAAMGLDKDAAQAPPLSHEGVPGAPSFASWLMPRRHLLWMGSGGTVGSTHFDPFENLMQVISGRKTFWLAHPNDGAHVGGFVPMVEGKLELAESGGRQVLVRSAAGVSNQTIGMHHYAAASLGTPPEEQTHLPTLARAQTLRCDVQAGEVLFTPAYWWHEVRSEADAARGHSSIGINWFYESFYQRIFPNSSWQRSPHYALLAEPMLDTPFPPHSRPSANTPERRAEKAPNRRSFNERLKAAAKQEL
jgi:hypothetical protein